jgi:hypothetical protein
MKTFGALVAILVASAAAAPAPDVKARRMSIFSPNPTLLNLKLTTYLWQCLMTKTMEVFLAASALVP